MTTDTEIATEIGGPGLPAAVAATSLWARGLHPGGIGAAVRTPMIVGGEGGHPGGVVTGATVVTGTAGATVGSTGLENGAAIVMGVRDLREPVEINPRAGALLLCYRIVEGSLRGRRLMPQGR